MDKLAADGVTHLYVLPTHLLYGDEYDKMCSQLDAAAHRFASLAVATPLLATDADMQAVLRAVADGLPAASGEALVLMGHGTPHFCNTVYAAMDYHAKAMGLNHIFIGTVEAFPRTAANHCDIVMIMSHRCGDSASLQAEPADKGSADASILSIALDAGDGEDIIFRGKSKCFCCGVVGNLIVDVTALGEGAGAVIPRP